MILGLASRGDTARNITISQIIIPNLCHYLAPMLVKCTGECRGAKAALARYKRKVERLKKIGKDSGLLDDWRNTSYVCGCRDE